MHESVPVDRAGPNVLFGQATVRTLAESSIVLLAAALGRTPGPGLFDDLEPGRPANYAVVQDLVIIDYESLQCLVVPGDPHRLHVQWKESRTVTEAREFARRFFRVALGPRVIGVNFHYRFDFGHPAVTHVLPFLNREAVEAFAQGELQQAGVRMRFDSEGWRTLLAIEPGRTSTQATVQVNFERDADSAGAIDAALDSIERLVEMRESLVRGLQWTE